MTPHNQKSSKEKRLRLCQQKVLMIFRSLSRFFHSEEWTIHFLGALASLGGALASLGSVFLLWFILSDIEKLENYDNHLNNQIKEIKKKEETENNDKEIEEVSDSTLEHPPP